MTTTPQHKPNNDHVFDDSTRCLTSARTSDSGICHSDRTVQSPSRDRRRYCSPSP
jgi:hypothetical protein